MGVGASQKARGWTRLEVKVGRTVLRSEGKPNKICAWIGCGCTGATPRSRAARWMVDLEVPFSLDFLRIAYQPSRLGGRGR